MQSSSKDIIITLLQSNQFKSILSQEVSKQLQSKTNSEAIEDNPKMMQISDVIADISQNLEQIVGFNIKDALQQEYGDLLEDCGKMKKEIEDIKQQLFKIKGNGKNIFKIKQSDLDTDLNDSSDTLEIQSKIGTMENSKINKQIESIKLMILKFTNSYNTNSQELRQSKILQQSIDALGNDINQLLQSTQNGKNIIQSIGVQTCMKEIKQITLRQKKFQMSICEKYQTSLKSIWNVITMMESNFEEQRSGLSDKGSQISNKK